MRRGNGGGIRRTDSGLIESVNMGSDFTAEHEWGIEELERYFGLNKAAAPGASRRTMTAIPRGVTLDINECIISYDGRPWSDNHALGPHALGELEFGRPYADEPEAESQGAWSSSDFAVRFRKTEQGKRDVQDLYDAFQRKDIAFLFQNVGNNPFARAGLNLVIVSRLPKDIVDNLAEKDSDNDRLQAAAEATGIKARVDAISKVGSRDYDRSKGYFSLRPSWAEKGTKSAYPVVFWLNPSEQRLNESGWYTVEELDQWLEGKGPVVKSEKTHV